MNYPHKKFRRMKPKAGAKATKKQVDHREWVREQPCLVCGTLHEIVPHHVTGHADKIGREPRNHELLVPLCKFHHQSVWDSKNSVEALSHRGFFKKYGIDLMHEAEFLRLESINEGRL